MRQECGALLLVAGVGDASAEKDAKCAVEREKMTAAMDLRSAKNSLEFEKLRLANGEGVSSVNKKSSFSKESFFKASPGVI